MISTWFSILYQPPYATDNTMLAYSTWFVYISSSFFRFTICSLDIFTIITCFSFAILVKNNKPRLFKCICGHGNDWNIGFLVILQSTNLPGCHITIHFRHLNIHEDQIIPVITDLFNDTDGTGAEDDDFDLSEALEKAAFVERGDVWTVGRHRLMCGDATIEEDVLKLMDGKKANLILTDPPYGVSFQSSDGLSIQNDSIKGEEFYQFLLASMQNMVSVLEPGEAAYVFHADTEGLNFRRTFVDAGLHLAGCCIWVKNSLVLGRSDYQWQHEPVLYGFLKNGKHSWYSDRKQTTIWNFDKPKRNKNHPTSKPLDLLAYPIGNSTQANAIVLDTFGGSGSTLMACEQTNRICCTMELDEKYASVILRRYVEDGGNPDEVYMERNGQKLMFADLVKQVE